jgi:bacterioferritin (cytochrome b1)
MAKNHYSELDDAVTLTGRPFTLPDATFFFGALHKLAEEAPVEAVPAEAATPVAEPASAPQPDVTGALEGEFAVPVEQVVLQCAQIVAQNFKQQLAYLYYGEMMRDLGRGELAELFTEQAKGEMEEAQYFLRRISVLMPGGVPIPVSPTPVPLDGLEDILSTLIAGEQQAIVLFKTLRDMLGENPMRYTVEHIMTDAQEHLDKLWQYMPRGEATAPVAEAPVEAKVAGVLARLRRKLATAPAPGPNDIVTPEPGTESIAETMNRESMLQHAQTLNENQDLKARLEQTVQQVAMVQQTAESATAENQLLQQQMQQTRAMADQATQQATQMSDQAAAEADAKMRLSMRINQLKQNLANIVSSDELVEEGLDSGGAAGFGGLQTAPQQQAQAQAQAEAQAQQAGAGAGGPAAAAEETAQAQRAQQEADQQAQQAQQAAAPAQKTSSARDLLGAVRGAVSSGAKEHASEIGDSFAKSVAPHGAELGRNIGKGLGDVASEAGSKLIEGGSKEIRSALSKPKNKALIAAAGTLYGGAKLHGAYKQRKRDQAQERLVAAVENLGRRS